METNFVVLAVITSILVVVLSFMLHSARRKLELYGFLSYDNKPNEVFKAINRLPSTLGKEINFDPEIIAAYFDRYFKRVIAVAKNLELGLQPIVMIGEIFSALEVITSKKEKDFLETMLKERFRTLFYGKECAEVYFLYLKKRSSFLSHDALPVEQKGEKIIFQEILFNGKHVEITEDFLDALEALLVEAFNEPVRMTSSIEAFLKGQLVRIRAKLNDQRSQRIEV